MLFQRTFQLVRLEALLEASKLTISFLKGLLDEGVGLYLQISERTSVFACLKYDRTNVFHVNRKRVTN